MPRVCTSIVSWKQWPKPRDTWRGWRCVLLFLWEAFDALLKIMPGHTIFNLCASNGCSWDSPMGIDPWTRSWLVTAYVWSWKLPCYGQYDAVGCVTRHGGASLERRGLGLALAGVCSQPVCSLYSARLQYAPILSVRAEGSCCWKLYSNSCRSKINVQMFSRRISMHHAMAFYKFLIWNEEKEVAKQTNERRKFMWMLQKGYSFRFPPESQRHDPSFPSWLEFPGCKWRHLTPHFLAPTLPPLNIRTENCACGRCRRSKSWHFLIIEMGATPRPEFPVLSSRTLYHTQPTITAAQTNEQMNVPKTYSL